MNKRYSSHSTVYGINSLVYYISLGINFLDIVFIPYLHFIGKKCTHLAKGLNLPQLKKIIIQGFKLQECEDCVKIVNFSKADAKSETENESNLDPEKKDLLENSEIKINCNYVYE
jgi:hypothetical protein